MADTKDEEGKAGPADKPSLGLTPDERAQVQALAEQMRQEYREAKASGHPLIRLPEVD